MCLFKVYATLCEGQGLTADAADVTAKAIAVDNSESVKKQDVPTANAIPIEADTGDGKKEEAAQVDDLEKGDIEETVESDFVEDVAPDITGVSKRLQQYSKADILYAITGYAGSIIVGALPAGEAVLFGMITGNFFTIKDAQEMRDTNYALSMWFFLLAGLSFIGNVCMGIGLGVSGSRLTRRMRVLVFDKLMRNSMGWFDFPEHSTGELTTSLEEDSETVANVTGLSQGQRIQVFSCLAAGLIVALIYSWQIGLTAIACVPLIIGSRKVRISIVPLYEFVCSI